MSRLTVADVLAHSDADGPISRLRADLAAVPAVEVLRVFDAPPAAHRALRRLERAIDKTSLPDRPAGQE